LDVEDYDKYGDEYEIDYLEALYANEIASGAVVFSLVVANNYRRSK
jgi:hypothetical protein